MISYDPRLGRDSSQHYVVECIAARSERASWYEDVDRVGERKDWEERVQAAPHYEVLALVVVVVVGAGKCNTARTHFPAVDSSGASAGSLYSSIVTPIVV